MSRVKANRAKCGLCGDVIVSFIETDLASCGCGEIAVCGGIAQLCKANDFKNFIPLNEETRPRDEECELIECPRCKYRF